MMLFYNTEMLMMYEKNIIINKIKNKKDNNKQLY